MSNLQSNRTSYCRSNLTKLIKKYSLGNSFKRYGIMASVGDVNDKQEGKIRRKYDDKCRSCNKKVKNGILCEICDLWYHFRCGDVQESDTINESEEWWCKACKENGDSVACTEESDKSLWKIIEILQSELQEMQKCNVNLQNQMSEISRKLTDNLFETPKRTSLTIKTKPYEVPVGNRYNVLEDQPDSLVINCKSVSRNSPCMKKQEPEIHQKQQLNHQRKSLQPNLKHQQSKQQRQPIQQQKSLPQPHLQQRRGQPHHQQIKLQPQLQRHEKHQPIYQPSHQHQKNQINQQGQQRPQFTHTTSRSTKTGPKIVQKQKKRKIIKIYSDSHGRGLAEEINRQNASIQAEGFVRPGAPISEVVKDLIPGSAKEDSPKEVVVIMGGANDVARNEGSQAITSLQDTLTHLQHKKVIVINIPNRYDLDSSSCVNDAVKETNNQFENVCMSFSNVKYVDVNHCSRDMHTKHGQHMNSKGKAFVASEICNIVKDLELLPYRKPTFLDKWLKQQDNVNKNVAALTNKVKPNKATLLDKWLIRDGGRPNSKHFLG